MTLPLLADADLFWDALEVKEQELQQLLKKTNLTREEKHDLQADRESVVWLHEHWDDVQHNARCLKDFPNWLRTPPSRRKLFQGYCRQAVPDEWDRYLETHEPPFIFPTSEKLHAHLEHCQLCGVQLQLAEGRRRSPVAGERAWGDQIVLDFLSTFCREALAAVCDPEQQERTGPPVAPRVWCEAPHWRLTLRPGARPLARDEHRIEIPVRLEGPARAGPLELFVTAQFIPRASRQADALLSAFPSHPGESARVEWRPGRQGVIPFPLTVPHPRQAGRMILRYAFRTPPPAARLRGGAISPETVVGALSFDVSEPQ